MADTTVWQRVKRFLGLATCPDLDEQVKKARQEKDEAMEQLKQSNKDKKVAFDTLTIASTKAHETMQMNGQEGSMFQEILKKGRSRLPR